jgi:hypothetical protein
MRAAMPSTSASIRTAIAGGSVAAAAKVMPRGLVKVAILFILHKDWLRQPYHVADALAALEQ